MSLAYCRNGLIYKRFESPQIKRRAALRRSASARLQTSYDYSPAANDRRRTPDHVFMSAD